MQKLEITILLFLCHLTISCSGNKSDIIDNKKSKDSVKEKIISNSKNISNQIQGKRKSDNLKIAKEFTENYIPDSIKIKVLKNVPDSVILAFKSLRQINKKAQEKYLTLIFLKIYRGHLQCCHQSYELRTKYTKENNIDSIADPLLYEFNLITKQFYNNKSIEFISSGLAFDWVEKNKYLLQYQPIKNEYRKILKVHKGIEIGEFWKK